MADPEAGSGRATSARRRLLFIGDLTLGLTGEMRRRALGQLGYEITEIDTAAGVPSRMTAGAGRVAHRLGYPFDFGNWNQRLVAAAKVNDVVWLDKPLAVRPRAIRTAKQRNPHLTVVYYSPDNMLRSINRSRYFVSSLPHVDLFLTTKSFIVEDLARMGCRRVQFVNNAFDPKFHTPPTTNEPDALIDVSFVGTFEDDRAEMIAGLARSGNSVHVFGNGWERFAASSRGLPIVFAGPVYGRELAATLHRSRINLAFLRKANHDLQTTRTVEIPAAGGFMLAERTDEQTALFTEGVEAEYFEGLEELCGKVGFYLAHESERTAIAQAGERRCYTSDYTYERTLGGALTKAGIL